MEVEVENMEQMLFDIVVFSDGAISLSELLAMPWPKIRNFEKRLNEKIKLASGKKGTEYL